MGDLENYEKDMLRRDAELDRIQDELRYGENDCLGNQGTDDFYEPEIPPLHMNPEWE